MARWFLDRSHQRGIPSVSLRRLLPEAQFLGCIDLEVSGCSTDSRRIDPGQVFVAVRGERHDGHDFVPRAIERGAAGVVVERPCPGAGPLQVIVPDTRLAHARLSLALAGEPAERLRVVAVAGTLGRTAAAWCLRSILEAADERVGTIGAAGWSDGARAYPPGPAEPGTDAVSEMLAAMVERNCRTAIVEVSPDALRRRTVEAIAFDAALVTDLASRRRAQDLRHDHARLIRRIAPGGLTVVNADEEDVELLGAVNLDTRRVAFGFDRPADVAGEVIQAGPDGTRVRWSGFDREAAARLNLIGARNLSGALAAAALGCARDLPAETIVRGLEAVAGIPGRLEPVRAGQPFGIWLDEAQTELELLGALTAVRSVAPGRVHCVLGVRPGGEEHHDGLACACEEASDRVVLTVDHHTPGDPFPALANMLARFHRPGRIRVEPERAQAIEAALAIATPEDAVLIVGGGRRTLRLHDRQPVAFDRTIIARWCRRDPHGPERRSA